MLPHESLPAHPLRGVSRRLHDHEPGDPPGPDWRDLALAALVVCGFLLAAFVGGCAVDPDTYGDTARAVAERNAGARIGFGGIGGNAPAVVAGVVRQSGWLTGLGSVALLVGCVILSHPKLPNEIGFGLAAGGFALLVAGYLLPLYAGWLGLALVLSVAGWGLSRLNWDAITDRIKKTLTPSTTPLPPPVSL